jgi:hypothetical protein
LLEARVFQIPSGDETDRDPLFGTERAAIDSTLGFFAS